MTIFLVFFCFLHIYCEEKKVQANFLVMMRLTREYCYLAAIQNILLLQVFSEPFFSFLEVRKGQKLPWRNSTYVAVLLYIKEPIIF